MCRKLAHTPLSPTDILHSSIRRSMSIFEGWWPEVTPHFQCTTSTNMIFKILQHEIILIWHGDMMKLLGLMRKTLIDYYFLFKPFDKKLFYVGEQSIRFIFQPHTTYEFLTSSNESWPSRGNWPITGKKGFQHKTNCIPTLLPAVSCIFLRDVSFQRHKGWSQRL